MVIIFYSQPVTFDPVTEKHYHKKIEYDYNDDIQHYRVTYKAQEIIEYFTVADSKNTISAKASPGLWEQMYFGLDEDV